MRKNKRAKIAVWQLVLWPDRNGLLIIPPRLVERPTRSPGKVRSVRSELLSSRSALLRRVQLGKTSRVQSWFSSSSWRSLSSRIGLSFNVATDYYFSTWLTSRLYDAEFGVLTLQGVISDAKKDLGLSPETILRLLIKHTSESAEFCSDGQFLTLR